MRLPADDRRYRPGDGGRSGWPSFGGMTMAQMAMRWILDFPAASVVIPGASRPSQAKENAAISDLPPLSKDLHANLRAFYGEHVAPHIRGPY